jgi:hypothetical protein
MVNMQHKHLWVIFLFIQSLYVFQVKGQEQPKDTIIVSHPMPEKENLQLQPVQSTPQPARLELWNNDADFHRFSIDRQITSFNFDEDLKYLETLNGDSSSLVLPKYPGLGDYQNVGGTLGRFNITNRLNLHYGAFISVQYGYLFSTKQIGLGSNFLLNYAVTNKLQFQTWGQYVTPGNSLDPTFNLRTFFPTTHFGSGLQYDSNEKTKIKVGIEYQYDQSDKTWKPESGGEVQLNF